MSWNLQQLGLVLLRFALGLIFLAHGLVKFQNGIGNIAGWFASIGLPGFLAYVIAVIEVVGGALLILGLASRWISALFAIIMIGAIFKVKFAAGFMGNPQKPGYEFEFMLLCVSIYLGISGSPLFSLDRLLTRSSPGQRSIS